MKGFHYWLGIAADGASIVTAVVAGAAYGHYRLSARQRRLRLENHLRNAAGRSTGVLVDGQFSILDLMAAVRMTEEQIFAAALISTKIDVSHQAGLGENAATRLMLSYKK